jgi:hypothetical protein
MLQQETERAVPSSTWKSRAYMIGGTRPGTASGELMRSGAMFHGFIASFMVTQWSALTRELGANKAVGAAYAGAVLATMTLGGMLALQLKTIKGGRDALPMDPTTPSGLSTWGRAALTGGGFGIFGDFLNSAQTSYGHSPIETLAGPVVGMLSDMYSAGKAMLTKAKTGKEIDWGHDATNVLRNNTPFFSTAWPLQAAFNRVAMDQLQYLIDPKAHKSMRALEARTMKETGQDFWWRPGEMLPSRAPQLTPSR